MKPAYWIGLMAVVGALAGYVVFKGTGWVDASMGAVIGIMIGVLMYSRQKAK